MKFLFLWTSSSHRRSIVPLAFCVTCMRFNAYARVKWNLTSNVAPSRAKASPVAIQSPGIATPGRWICRFCAIVRYALRVFLIVKILSRWCSTSRASALEHGHQSWMQSKFRRYKLGCNGVSVSGYHSNLQEAPRLSARVGDSVAMWRALNSPRSERRLGVECWLSIDWLIRNVAKNARKENARKLFSRKYA